MSKLQISKNPIIEIEYVPSEFKEETNNVYIVIDTVNSNGQRKTITINIDIPEGHTVDDLNLGFSKGSGWNPISFE